MSERRPVFISYRREDEPGYAGWLYELMGAELGHDRIFKDIEGGLRDGDDYPDELARRVADCDVLLAVIGPGWLTAEDEGGRRRLDNPADWVRIEIASALAQSKRVVPVLVNGARYLHGDDLPEDLKPLARKQTRRLSNARFAPEARVLIAALPEMIAEAEAERADAARRAEADARREAEEEAARHREEAGAAGASRDLTPDAIEEARELANWNFIAPRRDMAEHRDHLSRYPHGHTAHFVRSALEEMVWEATDRQSVEELRAYLNEFPEGPNAERAAANLRLRVKEDRARAEAERKATEESLAWAEVSVSDDPEPIRRFLAEYPDGANAGAARKRLRELARHPTRRLILGGAAAAALGGVVTWQMQPGNALWRVAYDDSVRTFVGHASSILAVAFAPDGRTALSGSSDGTLRLWDVATGETLRAFEGHSGWVSSVAFSPDGRAALSGSGDGSLRLWNIATGQSLRAFIAHSGSVRSVAYAPDGRRALSGSYDRTLRLWDVATGESLRTFSGHTDLVMSVVFAPDGRSALSGSYDRTLRLWNVTSGASVRSLDGHSGWVTSVAFAPDGRRAISGSFDGTLRLWDVVTGENLQTVPRGEIPWSVAFAPDGLTALSGSGDGKLRLWQVETGESLRTLTGHEGSVLGVAIAPGGRWALSGSDDATLRLWDLGG